MLSKLVETSTSTAPNLTLDVSTAAQNGPEGGATSLSRTPSVDEGNLSPTVQSIRTDLESLGLEEQEGVDAAQASKPSDCVLS